MMSDLSPKKGKEIPLKNLNCNFDTACFVEEGKDAIESFLNKKCKRTESYIKKKREIISNRIREDSIMMKDYFDFRQKYMSNYFDSQERRIREDCMLEKELLLLELEEAVQLKILKKNLRMKVIGEESLTKEKIDVITLSEESDEEQVISSEKIENGRKKEEN